MSKKKRNNKRSARGHVEGNVIRWREKTVRYRIGKDGKPEIDTPLSHDEREDLSRMIAEIGGKKPNLPAVIEEPPPDNVTPIFKAKRTESTSGNEAEQLSFDKSPSINHNPFIKDEPVSGGYMPKDYKPDKPTRVAANITLHNRKREVDQSIPLSPSGYPISYFVTGKMAPKPKQDTENPVVYTPKQEYIPANDVKYDNSVQVRRVPDVDSVEYALTSEVAWFINHVQPDFWPSHIIQFVRWQPEETNPVVNTGAVRKYAKNQAIRNRMVNQMYQATQSEFRRIDGMLTDSQSEANLLRQELRLTKQELQSALNREKLLEFELAHRGGDTTSADEIRRELNSINAKTPPEDADKMLADFNLFKSFTLCDGLEHAFARYVYGDPRLGDVIRDHADMRCRERQAQVEHRNLVRFFYKLADYLRADYQKWWEVEYPKQLMHRAKQRNTAKFTAVRSVPSEACAYAAMSRKAKPLTERSRYYSTLEPSNRAPYLQNSMVGAILELIKPDKKKYKVGNESAYVQWWSQWLDYCEHKHLERSRPIMTAVVKGYNKFVDACNTEVDPRERKRKAAKLMSMRKQQDILNEQRERSKEERKAAKERKAQAKHIRRMQSLAH